MLVLIFVSMPLLALALENSDQVVVHDGDAVIKTTQGSVPETTIGPLPAYIYKPAPNHKFKYANYKHFPLPASTEEPTAVEIPVIAPLNVEGPPSPPPPPPLSSLVPFILSPYYLPYFSRMALYNDYPLMTRQQLPPTFADYLSRKTYTNGPRYADYMGAEKLFAQLGAKKLAKQMEGV